MATVPSFDTYTPGAVVTASNLNKNVRDSGNFFRQPPMCIIRQNTAQSIASSSDAYVTFDTVAFDNDGMADLTNNQIICQTGGIYLAQGAIAMVANGTGFRRMSILANGVAMSGNTAIGSSVPTFLSSTAVFRWSVGANLRMKMYQTSGANLSTSPNGFFPQISLTWIGA